MEKKLQLQFDRESRNDLLNEYYVIPILLYGILPIILYSMLFTFGVVSTLPNEINLNLWDAGFYSSIKDGGYKYIKGEQCNNGFFPLFAYFWKITCLGSVGISIVNTIIYLVSVSFLCKTFKPDKIVLGFFMAAPHVFIMSVPVTEALFFAFGTMILIGIRNQNFKILMLGALLASMTRPSFSFLIPAFIGMELMGKSSKDFLNGKTWKNILLIYLPPIILGFSVVILLQYMQTGVWFGYFEIQSEVWGRKFSFPTFPLGSNNSWFSLRLTILCLWVGMLASAIGIWHLITWLRKSGTKLSSENYELFSIIFVIMSLLSIVFFNPKWYWINSPGYSATGIAGICRYIQATPFFFIFLLYIYKSINLSHLNLLGILILNNIVWLMTDHKDVMFISIVSSLLLPYILYYYFRWSILGYLIILCSFIFQCLVINNYLSATSFE